MSIQTDDFTKENLNKLFTDYSENKFMYQVVKILIDCIVILLLTMNLSVNILLPVLCENKSALLF